MAEGADNTARVTLPDGTVIELPLLQDASGAKFLDIRKLRQGF